MEQEDRQAQVADLFSCIDKLLKGMQLYEGHGPLVDRLMKSAVLIESKKGTLRANHYHKTDYKIYTPWD